MRNFKKEIADMHPNIQVLEDIKSGSQKIKCRCIKEDYEWVTRSYDLLRGHGCHACSGVPRYNTETFKKAVKRKNVIIISEYKGAHKYVEWICGKCNEKQKNKAYQLIAGHSCRKCTYAEVSDKRRKTIDVFRNEVFELVGDEYEVFDNYKNTNENVKFKHNSCGFEFESIAKNFLNGSRCPKCNGGFKKKDTEYFRKEVEELTVFEYEFVGDYKGSTKKTQFKHKACGSIFTTIPDSFINQGTRCPYCFFISKGEMEIKKTLDSLKIKYEQQKTFNDLKVKGKLRFDFFLPDFNLCIEYDGKQHFEIKEHWGGEKEFLRIKSSDTLKNDYCHKNGINLLRINYKQKNINTLVKGILNV